jgi:hypothetical protein
LGPITSTKAISWFHPQGPDFFSPLLYEIMTKPINHGSIGFFTSGSFTWKLLTHTRLLNRLPF